MMAAALQAVRTLGAHSRAEELAPLLHAYAGLLVDHLLRQQAHIALLTQFWDAIGVSALAAMPRRAAPKQAKQAGADAGAALSERLPVAGEALLACNMAASLGVQLSAASARAGLWQAINGCLLPLAVRSLADLAAALPAPVGSAKASSSAAAPAASHAQPLAPALVAAMGSVCQVVVLYLQLRPGNVDAAATLQERGALAPLARLFLAAGAHAGAEPLRQALLCCAASSSATAKWLLAVPGVAATLQGRALHSATRSMRHAAEPCILTSPFTWLNIDWTHRDCYGHRPCQAEWFRLAKLWQGLGLGQCCHSNPCCTRRQCLCAGRAPPAAWRHVGAAGASAAAGAAAAAGAQRCRRHSGHSSCGARCARKPSCTCASCAG